MNMRKYAKELREWIVWLYPGLYTCRPKDLHTACKKVRKCVSTSAQSFQIHLPRAGRIFALFETNVVYFEEPWDPKHFIS